MDFQDYVQHTELTIVEESFKLERGTRVTKNVGDEALCRVVKNSWAQINMVLTVPERTIFLKEARPAFPYRWPLDATFVLRASVEAEGLSSSLHIVDMVQDDDGLSKADVILSAGSCEVSAYQPLQLIAIFPVTEQTEAGKHRGKIRLYAHTMLYDEVLIQEIPFTVKVEDICLPKPQKGRFYLNLWQHVFNIARHHEAQAYSKEHLSVLEPYAKALGQIGNRVITVLLSDIPWCGQGCYRAQEQAADLYEYNFVRIRKDSRGNFIFDFSFADAYIALMERYGAYDIMLTGLYGIWTDEKQGFIRLISDWPDAIHISYMDEKDGRICFMRQRYEVEEYFSAIYQWLIEKDYLKRCYLMGDEVNQGWVVEGWSSVMETLHRIMPDIRMNWDLPPQTLFEHPYDRERVDVYTPQIELYASSPESVRIAARKRLSEQGKCLWSVCCSPPVMNSFLYTNLCEVRLHGFMTEQLKMDGFIRWNFTAWPKHPRENLVFLSWPAGDTCFVYPGKGGQCLLSLRYLALRRGIEDYELCQMVKQHVPNADELIEKSISQVLKEKDLSLWDFYDYWGREKYMSLSCTDYEKARDILVDALLEGKTHDC